MPQGCAIDLTDPDAALPYLHLGASFTCIGMFTPKAVWRVLVASPPDVLVLFVAFD